MKLSRYLLLLLLLSGECIAQQPAKKAPERSWRDILGSSLSGKGCKPVIGEIEGNSRICKGVEGYSLLVKGDDYPPDVFVIKTRPQIFLISPDGKRQAIEYWDPSDPGYRGLNKQVGWVVVNTPKKSIAITFILEIEPKPDYAQWPHYDVIARVSPGPVCVVGTVPAGGNSTMDSVAISSHPGERPCLAFNKFQKQNWSLTARRLATEGKVEEARSALEQIKGHERFIAYREISNAQIRAGDKEGARSTLMTARAEALTDAHINEKEHAVMQVINGLAEAGFYDEAKADVKLVEEHDRLGNYMSIAWIQAEKEDFDAARTTYKEAIEIEMKETPPPKQDWNLARIAESQAYVGLIDDAKRTAAMIQHPDAKRSAEDHIRMRSAYRNNKQP
jgi:hypothetical protein